MLFSPTPAKEEEFAHSKNAHAMQAPEFPLSGKNVVIELTASESPVGLYAACPTR